MGAPPPSNGESAHTDEKATTTGRTVHICAASEDEKMVDALRKHLTGVHVTHANDLLFEDADTGRRRLIEAAAVIVVLVSADYVASPEHEADTALALARHDAKAA